MFSLIFCLCYNLQGRHVKTGQLAAIKVMDVTEVSLGSIQIRMLLAFQNVWVVQYSHSYITSIIKT